MNTGKYGAYKQLTVPNSDLSNTIVQQEYLNRADKKDKEEKAEKERAKQLAKTKELAGINSGNQTRYLNFEHSLSDLFQRQGGLTEKYANAQKRLEADPTDTEAAGIKTNIERTVQQIATVKNAIMKYNSALAEGIASGKISKKLNEGYLTNMQKINNGGVQFDVDDYGNVTIKNTGKTDLDGDGFPDELSLESIADKNNFGVWESDFDLNTFNANLKKKYGEKETFNHDPNDPFKTTEIKGYDEANSLLVKDDYRAALGNDVNSLTNAGKSYLYQIGLSPKIVQENPKLYDDVINDLETGFAKSYNNKKFEKINNSGKTARINAYNRGIGNKKSKNSLRTTVDGILAGDERYLKGLIGQKLEEQGSNGLDVYIRNAEYVNGEVIIELSSGNIEKINTKNREEAIANVLELVRPDDKQDQRESEYRKGQVEVEYQPTNQNFSKISLENEFRDLNTEEAIASKLKSKGIKVEEYDWGDNVKVTDNEGNVTKFPKVNTDKGKQKLLDYIEQNWDNLTPKKEDTKKQPKPKENSKLNLTNVPEGGF